MALLPVDQKALNAAIKSKLKAERWRSEPVASGEEGGTSDLPDLRGDFVRNRVFLEVEFGNVASMYRDLLKFQIASRSRSGEVAVLVTATRQFAKFFDTNVATFENTVRHLPYLSIGIQMPIWLIGIEPDSFEPVRERYDEMHELCHQHQEECHTFQIYFDAGIPEPGAYEDE
jgi:hypothetical protein